MADITGKLINELTEQTTMSDDDYMIIGGADAKKISVANLKSVLGIGDVQSEEISSSTLSASGRAQKWGNLKSISWVAQNKSEISQSSASTLGTLSSDFRPTYAVEKIIMLVSGERVVLNISTDGTVKITPQSSALAANRWVSIYEVFM